MWAFIPDHLYSPPIPAHLLGNALVLPDSDGVQVTFKLLSVDPANYDDAPSEGIRRLLQIAHGKEITKGMAYDSDIIGGHGERTPLTAESMRMGTTVATNALLERKGEPFGLVLTSGFPDLIEIGDQTRPDLFDLSLARKHKVLYRPGDVVMADERVTLEGWSLDPSQPSPQDLLERAQRSDEAGRVAIGVSGEAVRVLRDLDEKKLERDLQALYDRGLRALAVCLIHSYTYPGEPFAELRLTADHERAVGVIARRIGFTQISLSSDLSPAIKALPRGNSAIIDSYLSPILRSYVDGFNAHFAGNRGGHRSEFMKSDGGLVASDK